jgi:hypothetical protein
VIREAAEKSGLRLDLSRKRGLTGGPNDKGTVAVRRFRSPVADVTCSLGAAS